MARRGRPRRGTHRIDAAIDAMRPYGFPIQLVRTVFAKLLKVYGQDQWHFIEDCSYEVLIEACLRENDDDREDNPSGEEDGASAGQEGPSDEVVICNNVAPSPQTASNVGNTPPPPSSASNAAEVEGMGVEDNTDAAGLGTEVAEIEIVEVKPEPEDEPEPMYPVYIRCPRPVNRNTDHTPCYGWLDSDEDEEEKNDFVLALPLPHGVPLPPGVTVPPGVKVYADPGPSTQQSMWD